MAYYPPLSAYECDERWGKTSPTLRIAKQFSIPWDHVLKIADALIHDRYSHDHGELVVKYSGSPWADFRGAVTEVALRWRDEFHPPGEHL